MKMARNVWNWAALPLALGFSAATTACSVEDLMFWEDDSSKTPAPVRDDVGSDPSPQGSSTSKQRLPNEMVVIGDSIASGLLGGSMMGETAPSDYVSYLLESTSLHDNLMHIGELDKDKYSPFTGKYLGNSIESRLRMWAPKVQVFNPSTPGATAWDAARMIAQSIELGYDFDFAFIEIGHNDFCMSDTTVEEFRTQYRKNLEAILENNPKARLVLSSLVHVPSAFAVGDVSATATKLATWSGFSLTCSQVRDTMEKACEGWYSGKRDQYPAYVKVISDLAIEMRTAYPEARLVVAEGVSNPGMVQRDLMALDCFHPNRYGYANLADELWNTVEASGVLN